MRLRFLFQLKITILLVFLLILTITYFASENISLDQFVPKRYIGHLSEYEYDYKNDNDINHYDEKFAIISGESNIDGLTIYDQTSYPFTVVTAVSNNHFCSIQSWIYYMKGAVNSLPVSRRPRVIVYDIGLLDHQNKRLSTLHEEGYFTEFRVFDFEIYPAFWRIVNGTKGEYGWKPGVVSEVARDYPGLILWLDSGSYVMPEFLKHFGRILYYYNGFFSPTSSGYITDWTHPGVFKYFNDPARKYSEFKNCNGAVIAFDSNKVGTMMNNWLRCALVKDCIAPKGSNRKNHRQDQAILTYLVAREKRFCVDNSKIFGLKTHMDRVCKKNLHSYERISNVIWGKEQAPNK